MFPFQPRSDYRNNFCSKGKLMINDLLYRIYLTSFTYVELRIKGQKESATAKGIPLQETKPFQDWHN